MDLGAFSGSLAVKDIEASKRFHFTDVRELQRYLKARGISMLTEADQTSKGPASFMIADPDGNLILIDQHV